jgi:hypothetical protein
MLEAEFSGLRNFQNFEIPFMLEFCKFCFRQQEGNKHAQNSAQGGAWSAGPGRTKDKGAGRQTARCRSGVCAATPLRAWPKQTLALIYSLHYHSPQKLLSLSL